MRRLRLAFPILALAAWAVIAQQPPDQPPKADAKPPVACLPSALWDQLGLSNGASVRVSQGAASAVLTARLDASLAPTAVRVPAGHPHTASLGAMFGPVVVEKA